MRVKGLVGALCAGVLVLGCAASREVSVSTTNDPFVAPDLPILRGHAATCAGPHEKAFTLDARETTVDLGNGLRYSAWTFNGTVPGPVLEACEGDQVTITLRNNGVMAHGIDSHALRTDTMQFGPVPPQASITIRKVVDSPGAFMYHCAAGPMTDMHIKSGMNGAMIVYPRNSPMRPARELVVVESAVFGDRDASGVIATDPVRAFKNDPAFMMFNGRVAHTPLAVEAGELVRAYVVNVGPGTAAIHVMGTILDSVHDGATEVRNVQTYGIPAGSGASIEFRIPEPGMYGLVDHDRLSSLPYGMVIAFDASGSGAHGAM